MSKRTIEVVECDMCREGVHRPARQLVGMVIQGQQRALDVCTQHLNQLKTRSHPFTDEIVTNGQPQPQPQRGGAFVDGKKHPCPYCNRTWTSPQALAMHVVTGHPGMPTTKEIREKKEFEARRLLKA